MSPFSYLGEICLKSQSRFVLSLVRAIGMAVAGGGGEAGDARAFGAAVLAGVAGFIAAFVEDVLSFVRAIGMALAGSGSQAGDA